MNKKSESSPLNPQVLDSLLKKGDLDTVAKIIVKINRNKIQRDDLVQFANIANRVNQGRIAHRLLQPVIRAEKSLEKPPSDLEKTEYAEALRSMGLIEEAKSLLREIDSRTQPLAILRMAFCLMTQWKYDEAIPYLKQFIGHSSSNDYTHVIAQVNLAASLIIERNDQEALDLLDKLKIDTSKSGHHLLYGNCLELMSQLFVYQGHFDKARSILTEAEGLISDPKSRYSLYIKKWQAISNSLAKNKVQPELITCRAIATENSDWETVRECDLYMAFLNKNDDLLRQVYFGTPYATYRKRILSLAGPQFLNSETYIWNPSKYSPIKNVFNLNVGQFEKSGDKLESHQLMHKLMRLLASDFYRPFSTVSLFSELFPNEFYSQQGSANRVSQLVKRLRQWLKDQGDLITIEEKDNNYRLICREGTGILVPKTFTVASGPQMTWNELVPQLPKESFNKKDVISVLNCSTATANRLLRWAIKEGHCLAVGAGPNRKYRFK